jgi:hypothetical protein
LENWGWSGGGYQVRSLDRKRRVTAAVYYVRSLPKVSELIDQNTSPWKTELVRNTFWKNDADVILATPIRPDFEDFTLHYDCKVNFSVI